MAHIGKTIKKVRTKLKRTQATMAADTLIPASRISRIESGLFRPSEQEVNVLARYLGNLEILHTFWKESQTHETVVELCERMGCKVLPDQIVTAQQFCTVIATRATRVVELVASDPPSPHDAAHQERLILAGQELLMIGNLATALRMLICDIKG